MLERYLNAYGDVEEMGPVVAATFVMVAGGKGKPPTLQLRRKKQFQGNDAAVRDLGPFEAELVKERGVLFAGSITYGADVGPSDDELAAAFWQKVGDLE